MVQRKCLCLCLCLVPIGLSCCLTYHCERDQLGYGGVVGSRDLALVVTAVPHHHLGVFVFTLVPIFHASNDDGDEGGEDGDDGIDGDDGDVGHLPDHQHKLRPLLCSLGYSSVKKMIMGILDAKFYLMTHPNEKQWKRRNMVLIRRSQS